MKEDQERRDGALVPHSGHGIITRSASLVRRGLDDLVHFPRSPLAVNSLGMEFVMVPAGSFMMGSDVEEDEEPIHEVTISEPFYIGRHPVTQSQWREVMPGNSEKFIGDHYPVNSVSWEDAQEFIGRLNQLEDWARRAESALQKMSLYDEWTGEDRRWTLFTYRLPSEAEWEYACRAGSAEDYAGPLDSVAWYANNSGENYLDAAEIWRTWRANENDNRPLSVYLPYHARLLDNGNRVHSVGTKDANAFGLFDMHGNVWEWCQDFYDDSYYRNSPATDPKGPSSASLRVLRGGSYFDRGSELRSARRHAAIPGYAGHGLRIVAVVPFQ